MKTLRTLLVILASSLLLSGCFDLTGSNVSSGTSVGTLITNSHDGQRCLRDDGGMVWHVENMSSSPELELGDRIIYDYTWDRDKSMEGYHGVIGLAQYQNITTDKLTDATPAHIDTVDFEAITSFNTSFRLVSFEFLTIEYTYKHGDGESSPVLYRDIEDKSDTLRLYLKQKSNKMKGKDAGHIHSFNLNASLPQYQKGDTVYYKLYYDLAIPDTTSSQESILGGYVVY